MAGEQQEHQTNQDGTNVAGNNQQDPGNQAGQGGGEGGAASGGEGSGQDGGGQRKPGGDLKKAVQQERQRRREAQRRLKQLEQQLAESGNGTGGNGNGNGTGTGGNENDPLDMSDLALTEDDLEDVDSLNRKIAAREQRLRDFAQQGGGEEGGDSGSDVQGTVFDAGYDAMENYGVFEQTDDPDLARDAEEDTLRALSQLGPNWKKEDVEKTVQQQAQKWDRYLAKGSGSSSNSSSSSSSADNTHEGPVPGGGPGSAEAAHLNTTPEPAESFGEASKRARKRAKSLQSGGGQ